MSDDGAVIEWLHDVVGIDGFRRVVRRGPSGILVSKFQEGFAARLHETVDALPGMFDHDIVASRFAGFAAADPARGRTESWRLAINAVIDEAAKTRGLARDAVAEVLAGVDSVAAILDTILWTSPAGPEARAPEPSEVAARDDILARMNADRGLFTRHYGMFEGVPVENHCPGAQVARRLFGQGWTICTGTPV